MAVNQMEFSITRQNSEPRFYKCHSFKLDLTVMDDLDGNWIHYRDFIECSWDI